MIFLFVISKPNELFGVNQGIKDKLKLFFKKSVKTGEGECGPNKISVP